MPPIQTLRLVAVTLLLTAGFPLLPAPDSLISAVAQTAPERKAEDVGDASREANFLLQIAKQHFRRAEFKPAIALYQQVLDQPGSRGSAKIEALLQLGDIHFWIDQVPQAETYFQQALKLARDSQDRAGEAGALAGMAAVYRNRQEYPKALETLKTALAMNQQMDDLKGEARSRLLLGTVFYWQTQYPQALEAFQQALKVAQADNNQDEMALIYNWMAVAYRELKDNKQAELWIQQQQALSQTIGYRTAEYNGLWTVASLQQQQPDQALQTYQKQVAIAQAADNPWFQRSVLLEIGWLYVNQKQTPKALEAYQKALTLAKTIDDAAVADVQNRIGVAYYRAEQYPKAAAAYQQALAIYLKTKDNQASIAQVWFNIGEANSQLKQYPKSIETYQQALAIYQQLNNENSAGNTQNRIGNMFYRMEQYSKAVEFYHQVLGTYQKLNKQPEIAQIWTNIGNAYYWQKQYPKAVEAFQQALKLHQAANRPKAVSQAWKNIGDTYRKQEQYSQALEAYEKALEIARSIADRAAELNALRGQGFVYTGQGQSLFRKTAYKEAIAAHEKAIAPWQQAQALAKELKNVQSEQIAIERVLASYFEQGLTFASQQHYAESISAFQQGLVFWRQHRDRLLKDTFLQEEQSTLQQLGITYADNGQYAKALTTYQEALQISEQLNDAEMQSQLLNRIAQTYKRLGNYQEALEVSQRSLALVQERLKQDPESEMFALIKVGQILNDLGQYTNSLTHYQQALDIARRLKDIETEATLLSNISSLFSGRGEYLQALELLQQSLTITQTAIQRLQAGEAKVVEQLCDENNASLGQHGQKNCLKSFQSRLSTTLNNLAFVYDGLGRYPDALKTYEQALVIAQQYTDLDRQTTFSNNIGSVYFVTGNYPKALEFFQKSLAIAVASGARPLQAITLNNIGQVYKKKGHPTKALDYYQQSLALAQAIQSPQSEATAINNMGGAYSTQGNYARALEFYRKSLAIRRKHDFSITTELNNIANVYTNQGQYLQAIDQLQQALEIARKVGDRPQEVILLQNIGAAYQAQSNYAKALELYQQAQRLLRTMGSRSSELADLLILGQFYIDLGQYPQALEQLQQALSLSRELGRKASEATALGNIAAVYRRQEKYPQALHFYQQSLTLIREIGDITGESNTLQRVAQTYEKQGNTTQAMTLLQQALTIQRKTGARPNEALTLNTLGRVYTAQGKMAAAEEALQQALAIAQSVGDRATEAETLVDLGKLFQRRTELAIVFYKQSVNVREIIRIGIRTLPRESQESYTQNVAGTYRALADLLLGQGRILEAQQVLELLKIQEIREFTREARTTTSAGIATTASETKILKDHGTLIAFGQTVDACKQSRCAQLSQLNDQQQALTQQYNQTVSSFEKEIRQRKSVDDTVFDPRSSPKVKEIVESQPGTVLIYPFVLEDKIWLLWAAKGGIVKSVSVPVSRKQLGEAVVQFRRAVQDPSPIARKTIVTTGKQLYDWLIKPLEPELKANKIQNLVFSLDRVTHYIPMSALFDGEKFLIENYAISTILSAELTDLRDRLPANNQTSILAMGASEFKDDSPLPSVPAELDAIIQQTQSGSKAKGGFSGSKFLNQAFTFRALRDNLVGHKILHIATHGKFVAGRPEDSFLVLGNSEKLTIPEIKTLQDLSNIHLVVLSACETGLGGADQDGIEISGLSSYFLSNGAKAVMASLWSVNDASTSVLMSEFYRSLASNTAQTPMTKAEALRQAQLSLIREGGNFARPYHWAPFTLIGNGL